MQLKTLSIVNFKNVAAAEIALSGRLNCFVGDNGAGKTNVLDAVHYLSMCRSSLGTTDRQGLRHGAGFFVIEGGYEADGGHSLGVVCSFSGAAGGGSGGSGGGGGGGGGAKKIRVDGKERERFSDHLGTIPLVMVSPADTCLISDAADERRRWLNSFISQLDRAYLQSLVRYNAVLAERNRLLKAPFSLEVLEVFDAQLAAHGTPIFERRARVIEELAPLVAEYYAVLSGDREQVELTYRSELSGASGASGGSGASGASASGRFAEVLASARERDAACGFTTSGVHRDDLTMRIGGHPLRKYGSQGQQKSFLVALKLAQFVVSARSTGERPILLLDDLFDKLDVGRVDRLLDLVAGATNVDGSPTFGQIFISDCNRARLTELLADREYKLFELCGGHVL